MVTVHLGPVPELYGLFSNGELGGIRSSDPGNIFKYDHSALWSKRERPSWMRRERPSDTLRTGFLNFPKLRGVWLAEPSYCLVVVSES